MTEEILRKIACAALTEWFCRIKRTKNTEAFEEDGGCGLKKSCARYVIRPATAAGNGVSFALAITPGRS